MQFGYKTSYLLLASFLVAKNERLAEVLPTAQRFVFSFEGSPSLAQHVTGFFGNETVPIADFVAAFRRVKDLLRQALEDRSNHLRIGPCAEDERAGV
jgi:hypothetical protein